MNDQPPVVVSRWCRGDPQIFTFYGCCHDLKNGPGCEHEISPHVICASQRRKGHDHECHRVCCWGLEETESRDCGCHPSPQSHEVLAAYRGEGDQSNNREIK